MVLTTRSLLNDVPSQPRQESSLMTKCRMCRVPCCRLKPETNLAMMMCLVFYLYICLGGALFLLLEGQNTLLEDQQRKFDKAKPNVSGYVRRELLRQCKMLNYRGKVKSNDNLWNFLEATDFAYQIVTGQGTGQTTRTLVTKGSKVAYIFFMLFGVPLSLLTFRATGQRLNILVYSTIRFINVKLFCRQLTPNVHFKALVFNFSLFVTILLAGTGIYVFTQQGWTILDSFFFTINIVFTVGNSDNRIINDHLTINSERDKLMRVIFNLYSFVALTVLSSLVWSVHHFTRHMRFQAQNKHLARNGDTLGRCPWVEVTRSQAASPSNKSTRERETDRESVC